MGSRRVVAAVAAAALLATAGGAAVAAALSPGGPLDRTDRVPEQYRALVASAADRCPAVPAKVLAAQLAAESGWDARAVSPAGAQGIAQFLPAVWEQYGIDGNGDGVTDIWDPADAIPSAAELNCVNRDLVAQVPGDPLINTLAAYNAGFNAVRKYKGVPPFPETQTYVQRIQDRAANIVL